VRARDEALNVDANTGAVTGGATNASFSDNMQPLFEQNCAVTGCHVSASRAGGLVLAASVVYGNTVGVLSSNKVNQYVNPGNSALSYIYMKITKAPGIKGNQMPAPGTGNTLSQDQKNMVQQWIDQGALQN
jgi:hypothetical protein